MFLHKGHSILLMTFGEKISATVYGSALIEVSERKQSGTLKI